MPYAATCWLCAFVITSPVQQYAACAGLVTVIAGCCAAICCMWAFVITGRMQQHAAYVGPAHCNHKPYAATCGMWALVITGPVQQYAGYASPVHCNCKLCAAICNIRAFLTTGSVQRCAGRVQSVCSQSPGFVQQHVKKSDVSVEVSFPVSKKTQTLPLVCTSWRDGLGVEGLGSACHFE